MGEPGVLGTRVGHAADPELPNTAEALELRGINEVEKNVVTGLNANEIVDGVADHLACRADRLGGAAGWGLGELLRRCR
ncbi:MAG: hypothetical protein WCQ21_23240 [Verrucomicrobiota bacterium]